MKKTIRLFIFASAAVMLLAYEAAAQKTGQLRIDSLLAELPKAKDDTNKVNLLNDLSYTYRRINTDEGIKYGEQALKLAGKIKWIKGIAYANSRIGNNFIVKSDHAKAQQYLDTSFSLFDKLNDKIAIAKILQLIGVNYDFQSDYTTALDYYSKALKIYQELRDKNGIASILMEFGLTYSEQSLYPKALQYYFASLKIYEELGDKNGMAGCFANLGNFYYMQSDLKTALAYQHKSLKIFEELGDVGGIAAKLNDIGNLYNAMRDFARAREYFLKALKINEETGNKSWIAANLGNIGECYMYEGDMVKALDYYSNALKIKKEAKIENSAANIYRDIFVAYISIALYSGPEKEKFFKQFTINKTEAFKRAEIYIDSAIVIYKETGDMANLCSAYSFLSSVQVYQDNYKDALESYKMSVTARDSVYNIDNTKKIAALEKKRTEELNQKQLEIKDLELSKEKNQRWFFIVGIFLLLCLSGVLFNRYRLKKKANIIITKEKQRSEELLLNILPEEVAEELKAKGSAEAKLIDEVTVLFTDFKGFTAYSEKLSPKELVRDIHECFSAFDQIIEKYGIEKIKTIGDSYMAAGGLPVPNKTHATDVVKAGLEIRQFIAEGKARKIALGAPYFEIRIGIHTGPVVAGIVGIKKFAYDIWGDTVNTASRMESSGDVGQVNISGCTYELVKDQFTCTHRGKIEAKSKGMVDMYFVESTL